MWAGAAVAQGSSRHLGQQPAPALQTGPHPMLLWDPQGGHPLGVHGLLLWPCTPVLLARDGWLKKTSPPSSRLPPMSVLNCKDYALHYPKVAVQLPMFNERAVCQAIIDAACELRWPAQRLKIQAILQLELS